MKKCPFCAEEIQDAAIVCKHCGRDLPAAAQTPTAPSKKVSTGTGCLIIFLLLLGLGLLGRACGGGGSSTAVDAARELNTNAAQVCKQFVEKRLRAPATAKFQNIFDATVEGGAGDQQDQRTVTSYVDAQNGFGALIRSNYVCVVEHTTGNNFRLIDLKMDDQ